MKVYGYIKKTHSAHDMSDAVQQLESYGCDTIITDAIASTYPHPNFKNLVDRLKSGDTLVIYKFANAVRGLPQLTFLLEHCRTENIRLVSTDDHIDTDDEVSRRWQAFLGSFSIDRKSGERARRQSLVANARLSGGVMDRLTFESRQARDQHIIDQYRSQVVVGDIANMFGLSERTIFRVLHKNGIETDRMRPKGDRLYGGDTES